MNSPIYVIGHKNPDTDAICSAMAYAWFLREQGMENVEAACCGEINARAQFVLSEAGLPHPRLVMDVRPTIGPIAQRTIITAREDEALFEVYRRMQQHHLRALPALDAAGRLQGLLTFGHLMELVLPDHDVDDNARVIETSLSRMADVLEGSIVHAVDQDREESLLVMVAAMSATGFTKRMKQFEASRTIIVTGDRPTIQLPAIEYGVRCIIITGGYPLVSELLEMAQERGVAVIISGHDTATTTLLLRSAKLVRQAVQRDYVHVHENDLVEVISRSIQGSPQDLFPVLNDEGALTGVFSKSDLVNPQRTQLILVDHNEYAQAVTGADQAVILEVIDHHRLGGGLISREPIRFINEPVGSTCTIVTKFLFHRSLTPPREIALCLAAGIISDTLNLTSPTSTETDRLMLNWLSGALKMDFTAFAEKMFSAGSVLDRYPAREAVRMDCKEYTEGPWRFVVSQVEEMDLAGFEDHQAPLESALNDLVRERGVNFAALLVTDITRHYSLLMVAGDEKVKDAIDYPHRADGLFDLEGVVSRKKQLLPHLMRTLGGISR
jgi:manganese-dependent inorganic pyrophosphatase